MELIDNIQLILTCKDGIYLDRIPFELIKNLNLNQVKSFSARGFNGVRGPFISIPSNICLLSNLQILDLSFNNLQISSFNNSSSSCYSLFSSLQTLDLSSNQLIEFPIEFTSNLLSLENIYLQSNQLIDIPISAFYNIQYLFRLDFSYNNLTSFEFWTILVNISANYSNNNISKITNHGNFNLSDKDTPYTQIDLSNNGQIDLNDGIYEMYGVCSEVQYWLDDDNNNLSYVYPSFTVSLYTIDFGTTRINCTCNLYYIRKLIDEFSGGDFFSNYSLSNARCTDGITKLIEFNYTDCLTSTVNFTSVMPRLCKINESESGNAPVYIPGQNYTEKTTSTPTTITTTPLMLNISTCFSSLSISDTNLMVTCPPNDTLALLPIDIYSFVQLNQIIRLTIQGYSNFRGSLQTIPPNICFLPNLFFLNISFNRLTYLDSFIFSSNPSCLQNLEILDLSKNYLTQFPSLFLTHLINLDELFLQNNQLTSFDLSLIVLISSIVDLSNNQISEITNNANIDFLTYTKSSTELYIDLTNNSQSIDFTDAIYEMYDACYEIQQLIDANISAQIPLLTNGLLKINFNNSKINCSCNQYYMQRALLSTLNDLISDYPLSNTMCTDGSLFLDNNQTIACSNSSVNFSNISPRLCKINFNEPGLIPINATDNTSIIIPEIYPYYLTQTSSNSYCLFTFYEGGIRLSIDCINGTTMLTEISAVILMNIYFENITQVSIDNQSSIAELPLYLCVLPSTSIDLSNQSFRILDRNTFPCTFNSTLRYINLSYNQIILVNLTLINWIVMDLTSNNLSHFPYDLFNNNLARAVTQQTLRLSSNNLTEFDLFICTYTNILIDLRNNPFIQSSNGYNIIRNDQKQSLTNEPASLNLILSNQLRFLINDEIAQNYNACDSRSFNILIQIFEYMNNNNLIIEIECQCSSFYMKEYYHLYNSSTFITDQFPCSNSSMLNQTQFESLTETNCLSNIVLSSDKLCQFFSLNQASSLSNSPSSNNYNQLLAIVLGSVFGSVTVLLLVAVVSTVIYWERKLSAKASFSTPSQFEDSSQNLSWLYDLPSLNETTCRL